MISLGGGGGGSDDDSGYSGNGSVNNLVEGKKPIHSSHFAQDPKGFFFWQPAANFFFLWP